MFLTKYFLVETALECRDNEDIDVAITDVCGDMVSLMDQTFEQCNGNGKINPEDRVTKYLNKCKLMVTNLFAEEKENIEMEVPA